MMKKGSTVVSAMEMGGRADREVFVVVSYDVPDDRRRLKVMKTLEGYGQRVQYSVFECWLTGASYGELRQRLGRLINGREDDVRFYELCKGCQGGRKGLGRGRPQERKEHVVV
jgi:CRISPR-associated protein Cas2